jgi:hypothetical protein
MSEPEKSAKRRPMATGLQAAGLTCAALGLGLVHVWLGLLTAGLGIVAFGVALELE